MNTGSLNVALGRAGCDTPLSAPEKVLKRVQPHVPRVEKGISSGNLSSEKQVGPDKPVPCVGTVFEHFAQSHRRSQGGRAGWMKALACPVVS